MEYGLTLSVFGVGGVLSLYIKKKKKIEIPSRCTGRATPFLP